MVDTCTPRGLNHSWIRGARLCLGAKQIERAAIRIESGRIRGIEEGASALPTSKSQEPHLDLSGMLLMPGLINAHDHLQFALYPRMGGRLYQDYVDWSVDIQQAHGAAILQQHGVQKTVRLWWGAIRNLLCGATTVCHHDKLWPELKRDGFPVRVVQRFGWAHSVALGGDLAAARAKTPEGCAFVIHACEGVNKAAERELFVLDRHGLLDAQAALVHGVAIDEAGLALVNARCASLILCPSSNDYLFGVLPWTGLFQIDRAALGSDSPLTAKGDLLDEIRFAIRTCAISAEKAYEMVTSAPQAILRLEQGEGTLRVGGVADLIGICDNGGDLTKRIATLSADDIEFVMIDGRVQLASDAVRRRLPVGATVGLERVRIGRVIRWLRAPVRQMLRSAEAVLGVGNVSLGGKQVSLP